MIESSKEAEKKALKQRQAIYASLTRNRNHGISITNEEQNSRNEAPSDTNTPSEHNTQDTQVNDDAKKKKARGPTRMAKLKGKEPVEVDLNVHSQIVDGSSITLSSYIGTVAREHVPVTLQSWKQLDDQTKDMLWSSLLSRSKRFRDIRLGQQIRHTIGRRGYARLQEIMVRFCFLNIYILILKVVFE
ncbi:hypothetical protein Q3G72_027604 [Acer saccharum]|nr:hypothetical protein Q3G72_027604 [Acer saccharum]